VLAVLPAFIPSTLISVVKPFVSMHQRGRIQARVTLERFTRAADLEWAELAVFCRNTEPRFAHVRQVLAARGIPWIYDLDDNLFEIPPDCDEGHYHRDPARLAELQEYIEGATLVRVYSDELLARVRGLNPLAEKVAPSLDWSLVPDTPPERDPSRVRIVYVTSRLEDELAQLFLPDLERLLGIYGERVEVTFWGAARAARCLPRVRRIAPDADYDRYFARLACDGFDIGLSPLRDDPFHRAKTNNKYREYGACRIAGVYSDVSVYSSCVRHEETGLLVPAHEGSWLAALTRLVEDAGLRERIQAEACRDVRRHYSQERAEEDWLAQIGRVLADSGRTPPVAGDKGGRSRQGGRSGLGSGHGLFPRLMRLGSRLRRAGLQTTLTGLYWYLHGLRTMLRLRRELSLPAGKGHRKPSRHRR
jgi:glycosyltransferase involved in cell wall biosynthesis